MFSNQIHKCLFFITTLFLIIISATPLFAGEVPFSWDAPTTNEDGSPLTDLAGYKVYYGLASGNYTSHIDVGNVTTTQVSNLTNGLTYYLAVTAYDFSGNESVYSSEVSKTVPFPLPEPEITVTDSVAPTGNLAIPFGNITEGSSSNQAVTISNDGNADLLIGNTAQSNSLAAPFNIISDNCSGQTIAPSSQCTLTVRFAPSTTGAFNDSFNIPSNDSDESSVTVSVSGTGDAIPVPDITVTDSVAPTGNLAIPFGNLTEGLSLDRFVTILNNGNADLLIGNIAQSNPLAAPFSIISDYCSGQTISPSSNCSLTVRFAPSTTAVFNDSFDIPSNDPDESSVTVNVSGTGLSSVTNNPPSTPQTSFPANNQTGLGTTVEFRWEKSTDPDGDMVTYDLYVCEDQNLTIGCMTELNIAFLWNESIYYAGMGSYGASLTLFAIISILTGITRYRKKRAVLIIATILMTGILLVACGGGGSGGGSGGAVPTSSSSSSDDGSANEISYTVSGLNTGTTYYWKVVAKDGNGGETENSVSSFQTE